MTFNLLATHQTYRFGHPLSVVSSFGRPLPFPFSRVWVHFILSLWWPWLPMVPCRWWGSMEVKSTLVLKLAKFVEKLPPKMTDPWLMMNVSWSRTFGSELTRHTKWTSGDLERNPGLGNKWIYRFTAFLQTPPETNPTKLQTPFVGKQLGTLILNPQEKNCSLLSSFSCKLRING